jgi:VanZ family protein
MDVTRSQAGIFARLDPWAPPVVLMAVIFALSAQPDLSTGLGVWDVVGRKLIHASEYALLCFLWWRAFRTVVAHVRAVALAVFASLAYAATDEVHQLFVHGRHGTLVDVAIDAVGIAVVATVLSKRAC